MKNKQGHRTLLAGALLPVLVAGSLLAAGGAGTIKLGHTFLDLDGNQSLDYRTYNTYEGTALSLEGMSYNFDNGMRATFNGTNLSLNNRNLIGTLSKTRLFGITVTNTQNRRIYDFDGGVYTRSHTTSVSGYLTPHPNVKLYGSGSLCDYRGANLPVFSTTDIPMLGKSDYKQTFYAGGIRLNDRGRSVNAEYGGNVYRDDIDTTLDQDRWYARIQGVLPVPRYEWLKLNAGYRYFESKFASRDEKFSAKTFWGGATAALNANWAVKYAVVFDRAGSDYDQLPTDNLTHAFYLTYLRMQKLSLTGGYQYGINDDLDNEVRTDGLYFSGWYAFSAMTEARADVGLRAEEVRDGARLLGDEDLGRFRASIRHRFNGKSMIKLRAENTHRENLDIDAKVDMLRFGGDCSAEIKKITFSGGYAYGKGKYENATETFEFKDNLVTGDAELPEWNHLTLGGGVVYYRSLGDLDMESVSMHFWADYKMADHYTLGVKYTGDNYDDLTRLNAYYTANIVEITIARDITF